MAIGRFNSSVMTDEITKINDCKFGSYDCRLPIANSPIAIGEFGKRLIISLI